MSRRVMLVASIALAVLLAGGVAALQAPSRPAHAASTVLPDLGMAELKDLQVQKTPDGRKLLRFSSIVVNVGSGAFELHGQRSDPSIDTMTITQRLFDDAGGYRDVATGATMYYSGDGHDHWHVRNLERFVLQRLDKRPKKVRTSAKHGFCFYDNYPYGSEKDAYYTRDVSTRSGACGKEADLLVTMGLSAGWGDIYHYSLPDQYIDITGLVSGKYRLRATVDRYDRFRELNDANNFTWVNIQLRRNSVKILGYGPSA